MGMWAPANTHQEIVNQSNAGVVRIDGSTGMARLTATARILLVGLTNPRTPFRSPRGER